MFSPKGQTIPPVGAYRAPTMSRDTAGSIPQTSSGDKSFNSFTPFSMPRRYSSSRPDMASSSKHNTRDPFLRNGKSSFFDSSSIISLPRTFNCALRVPGTASYPACTIPLLALEVPSQTSLFASSTAILSFPFASSLAMAQPLTPAPIMITS